MSREPNLSESSDLARYSSTIVTKHWQDLSDTTKKSATAAAAATIDAVTGHHHCPDKPCLRRAWIGGNPVTLSAPLRSILCLVSQHS